MTFGYLWFPFLTSTIGTVDAGEVGIGTSLPPGGHAPQHEAAAVAFPTAQGATAVALAGVHDALLGDTRGAKHRSSDDLFGVAVVPKSLRHLRENV